MPPSIAFTSPTPGSTTSGASGFIVAVQFSDRSPGQIDPASLRTFSSRDIGGVFDPASRTTSPILAAGTNLASVFAVTDSAAALAVPDSLSFRGRTHMLVASVADAGGNVSDAAFLTFTTPPPPVRLFLPVVISVAAGSNVTVAVTANLADGVFSAEGTVTYDATRLSVQSVTLTDYTSGFTAAFNTTTAGEVRFALAASSPLADSGELLQIVFSATKVGTASLGLESVRVNEGALSVLLTGGKVTVFGVEHAQNITSDEIWRAADNPHFVRGPIRIGTTGPATVTIEPGAEVRFSRNAGLYFEGRGAVLKAVGTPTARILMVADTVAPPPGSPDSIQKRFRGFWLNIFVTNSQSELRNVVMRHCAGERYEVDFVRACLILAGKFNDSPRPVVENVTIRDAGVVGVAAQAGAGFGPGSANLTITGTGPLSKLASPPIFIGPNEAGTIPTGGRFTGNSVDHVRVQGLLSDSERVIRDSQTWPNLGIPYAIYDTVSVHGPNAPMLTLAPGTELGFKRFAGLYVGVGGPGGLIAVGTAEEPIVFTSDQDAKLRGSWNGIVFGESVLGASKFDLAVVEAAGNVNAFYPWSAEIVVLRNGLDQLITNSTIRLSAGCGIQRAWPASGSNTDYTLPELNNSFVDNSLGDQCGP